MMEPKVIYEDEYVLALDKPSGMLVHKDGRSERPTLVDWIREHRPELEEVGEEETLQSGEVIRRPGIVHRLDRDTSGIIMVCKTPEAFTYIKKQFQTRRVSKVYHAVVWGRLSEREGVIDKPIGRSTSDFRKWSAESGAKGELREAITHYSVLASNSEFSYVEVRPKTGRTHQIRVHMKSINYPLICDRLYASKRGEALGFHRLALHALSISLELPSGSSIKVESELPEEFVLARKVLEA